VSVTQKTALCFYLEAAKLGGRISWELEEVSFPRNCEHYVPRSLDGVIAKTFEFIEATTINIAGVVPFFTVICLHSLWFKLHFSRAEIFDCNVLEYDTSYLGRSACIL